MTLKPTTHGFGAHLRRAVPVTNSASVRLVVHRYYTGAKPDIKQKHRFLVLLFGLSYFIYRNLSN